MRKKRLWQKARDAGEVTVIDEETDRAMYETAIDKLEKAGFAQYEISNFAKAGFQCRHNLFYWANKPYIGIGPAAASWWQEKTHNEYCQYRKICAKNSEWRRCSCGK